MSKIMFRKKDLLGANPDRSRAIKKLMENEGIAGILNQKRERREFRDALKKYTQNDRYVSEAEVRSALAELKLGRNDSLSREEIRGLRKELGLKGSLGKSDLAQDSALRKHKGGIFDTHTSRVSSTKRPLSRGLPF